MSGHCPISFALKSGSFCRYTNEDSFLKEKPNSFIWDVSSRQKFSKTAGSDDVVTSAMKIINLHMNSLNQNTQSKVNLVVNSVTEIIKDMASRCCKRRKIKPKRQNKTSKCNKQSDKWFDKTLEEMKQEVLRTAKILNKYPNDPIIRGKYYTLKKKFKKAVKEKEQNFKEKNLQQIYLMKSNNPQKFWEMVNELRTIKQKSTVENIEPKAWHMWFKQLNTAKYDIGDHFEKEVDFFIKHLKTFQGK